MSWSSVGTISSAVYALGLLPDGRLISGGDTNIPGFRYVAAWNGSAWTALDTGPRWRVRSMLVTEGGDVIVGTAMTPTPGYAHVQRWNGSTWNDLGPGMLGALPEHGQLTEVTALELLPNGDLVAGGHFTSASGVPANHIARWNGSAWSAIGLGVGGELPAVSGLKMMDDGTLMVVGSFSIADGHVSAYMGRWGCPVQACAADLNGDGLVDFSDYLEFLTFFDAGDFAVDFNHDGLIDFSDYLEFLSLFDAGC